jgi:hypothetical protein
MATRGGRAVPSNASGLVFAVASRLPFLVAVALVAAALGDSLVESVANSGLVGAGYADDNHLSVLPTLVAGAVLALEVARTRCLDVLRGDSSLRRRAWLAGLARRLAGGSPARDLPLVLGLQFAALFAMENAEQLLAGGRLTGGTAWLGGPVLFSLLTHGLIGAACTLLLGWLGRSLLAGFAALVRSTLDAILIELERAAAHFVAGRLDGSPFRLAQAPQSRRLGKRAPPLLAFVRT